MRIMECELRTGGAGRRRRSLVLSLALPPRRCARAAALRDENLPTPTIHDIPDQWGGKAAAALEKDSGGRIEAQVYPASQLGSIPRQIEGTQFGSIQMESCRPSSWSGSILVFDHGRTRDWVDSQSHGQRVVSTTPRWSS